MFDGVGGKMEETDLRHVIVHAGEVVPVIQAGRDGQCHVHAQQVEGVVAGLPVVLGDGRVEVLRWDFTAHGQQVQVAVHDVQRAHHPPERGRRERDLVRVLGDTARLRLAHVVQNSLVARYVGQLSKPRSAQVHEVQDLLEVLLGAQIVAQAVQKRRPLQQDVSHCVLELSPRHVLHGLVHDRHALVYGVAFGPSLAAGDEVLVSEGRVGLAGRRADDGIFHRLPAHHEAEQLVPIEQDVRVVRLFWIRPPHPVVNQLRRDIPYRGEAQVQLAQLDGKRHVFRVFRWTSA